MKARILSSGALIILGSANIVACAAESSTKDPTEQVGDVNEDPVNETDDTVCVPGHQTLCACAGGGEGLQLCKDDGSGLTACDCTNDETPPPDGCGDGFCSPTEDCHTCASDCGQCAPCEIAPSCDNATVPPVDVPHAPDFDIPKMELMSREKLEQRLAASVAQAGPEMRVLAAALDIEHPNEHPWITELRGVLDAHPAAADALRHQLELAGMESPALYRAEFPEPKYDMVNLPKPLNGEGGTIECGDPLLRLNIAQIKVHEEDDDFANDIVYCVVQAEASNGAEVRITPQTPNLDEGETHEFALESSVFWGQQGPSTPGGDLLVTYDCIEADTTDGYQNMVNAIGEAATELGDGVEGDNGWVLTGAGAIAPIVSTGLALDTDDQLFNAQQTIPAEKHLEMTNGTYWTVRRDGTHLFSDWDWELTIKAWGCAEYGTL